MGCILKLTCWVKRRVMHASPDGVAAAMAGSAGAVPCADDEECAAKAAREARSPAPAHFLWTQARPRRSFRQEHFFLEDLSCSNDSGGQ